MDKNLFYSKILLSGEFIIFFGARAFAIPFTKYSGKLDFINKKSIQNISDTRSNKVVQDLNQYFHKTISNSVLANKFKLEEFNKDIKNGLYFDSNIPEGYGIGSSGALSAAIYNKYNIKREEIFNNEFHNENLKNLKNELAYIESYFHGKSSGIDALVSYVNKPLLFQENSIDVVNYEIENKSELSIVLIDTGKTRNTQDLITRFNKELENNDFINHLKNDLIPASNGFTDALIKNNNVEIFKHLQSISQFQIQYFKPFILPEYLNLWEQGLASEKFFLKLCGSGGGGYLLGFIKDFEYFNNTIKYYKNSIKLEFIHPNF
jgi:mevalonate kinase